MGKLQWPLTTDQLGIYIIEPYGINRLSKKPWLINSTSVYFWEAMRYPNFKFGQ